MLPDELLVQHHIPGFQRQPSAPRHRVTRVHAQVHEHLLQLSRVGFYCAQVVRQIRMNLDVFSDDALQHFQQIADNVVEIQDTQLENLLPADRQHLPRQRGSAFRRLVNLLRRPLLIGFPFEAFGQCAAVAQDDRQQVLKSCAIPPASGSYLGAVGTALVEALDGR